MGWPALAVGLYVASADSAPRLRPPPRSVSVPVPPHPCRQRGPSARSVAGAQTGAERVPWCRVHHAGDWWRHRPPRRRPPAGPLRRVRSRSVPVVAVCRVLAIREFFVPQLSLCPLPVCGSGFSFSFALFCVISAFQGVGFKNLGDAQFTTFSFIEPTFVSCLRCSFLT